MADASYRYLPSSCSSLITKNKNNAHIIIIYYTHRLLNYRESTFEYSTFDTAVILRHYTYYYYSVVIIRYNFYIKYYIILLN